MIIRPFTHKALIALTAALLLSICPAAAQAQQAKGLDDPDFVGKWDFDQPGDYGPWKPLQAAHVFESRNGVVFVTATSMRPCLDLDGPYAAGDIESIEIRVRGHLVEQNSSGSSDNAMGGTSERVRVQPKLYRGTRLYFTRSPQEKYNAESSIEFPLPLDGKFHVLTINPHEHASWKGMIQKIRFDVGDFPHNYELDYIYFHRKASPETGGTTGEKKAVSRVGAISMESEKR